MFIIRITNVTAGLAILVRMPTKESEAKIETQAVTAELKQTNFLCNLKLILHFLLTKNYLLFPLRDNFLLHILF